ELSWNHVNHPSEVVKVGDEVEVEVLDVDLQRERISLGLKQTTPDPWIKLVENYPVGTIVDGHVTKIVPFGAFVELGDSIEGLVHISEMAARHIDTPAQVVKAGDDVKVKVMEINPDRRRISLSMKAAAEELGFEIEVDESIQAEEKPAKRKKADKDEAPAEAEVVEVETVEDAE
ncbi:MAG: S1 RNA-binding domain-containing protein, partial [Eggerthellaceae bacterium]|nr:S1 RNA-binding domain-containing protein [Eggerthellaceae bacterium]